MPKVIPKNYLSGEEQLTNKKMNKTAEIVLQKARERKQPVLVLVGQDKAAIAALHAYVEKCMELPCADKQMEEIQLILADFEYFAQDNPDKMKIPD